MFDYILGNLKIKRSELLHEIIVLMLNVRHCPWIYFLMVEEVLD